MFNPRPDTHPDSHPDTHPVVRAEITTTDGRICPIYAHPEKPHTFRILLPGDELSSDILLSDFDYRKEDGPSSPIVGSGPPMELFLISPYTASLSMFVLPPWEWRFSLEASRDLAEFCFPEFSWKLATPKEVRDRHLGRLLNSITSYGLRAETARDRLFQPSKSQTFRTYRDLVDRFTSELKAETGFDTAQVEMALSMHGSISLAELVDTVKLVTR